MEKQVKSRQRVADHGEVFTSLREVNAMLDLVKQETERIESRFLEPACGTGNFLSEILRRKLNVVRKRYAKSQFDFERNAVIAVSSIYGIDIQQDNVLECRERLFRIFDDEYYADCFKAACKPACRNSIRYILSLNIVWGDALTLKTAGENPDFIVFPEWSPINSSLIKRRDFTFHSMIQNESLGELELFAFISDQGEEVYIPTPEKDYPPVHFLELGRVDSETTDATKVDATKVDATKVDATSCRIVDDLTRQDDVTTKMVDATSCRIVDDLTRQDDVSTMIVDATSCRIVDDSTRQDDVSTKMVDATSCRIVDDSTRQDDVSTKIVDATSCRIVDNLTRQDDVSTKMVDATSCRIVDNSTRQDDLSTIYKSTIDESTGWQDELL